MWQIGECSMQHPMSAKYLYLSAQYECWIGKGSQLSCAKGWGIRLSLIHKIHYVNHVNQKVAV